MSESVPDEPSIGDIPEGLDIIGSLTMQVETEYVQTLTKLRSNLATLRNLAAQYNRSYAYFRYWQNDAERRILIFSTYERNTGPSLRLITNDETSFGIRRCEVTDTIISLKQDTIITNGTTQLRDEDEESWVRDPETGPRLMVKQDELHVIKGDYYLPPLPQATDPSLSDMLDYNTVAKDTLSIVSSIPFSALEPQVNFRGE